MLERRLPTIAFLMCVSTAFLSLSLHTRSVQALQCWSLTCVVGVGMLITPRRRREPTVAEQLLPLEQARRFSPETEAQLELLLANLRG